MSDTKSKPHRSSPLNNRKNKQRGYNNKKKSNYNSQKRGKITKNLPNHNPKTTLSEKNVPKEVVIQVKYINQKLENHFNADEVYYTLKDNNMDVEKTLEQLKHKKENSWSSLVKKNLIKLPPQNLPNAQAQNGPSKDKVETKIVDPQEKAQELSQTIAEELNEVKQKEVELMNIKQLLDFVKNEEMTISSILKEKEEIVKRKVEIQNEISTIRNRIKEIDNLLEEIESERTKKINEIEAKFSKR